MNNIIEVYTNNPVIEVNTDKIVNIVPSHPNWGDINGDIANQTDLQSALNNINKNIPNGAIVNGVCLFYQTEKPIQRLDGIALKIGDRWYNPSNFTECCWNGTYWLAPSTISVLPEQASSPGSDLPITTFSITGAGTGTNISTARKKGDSQGIFFHSYDCTIGCSSANSTNYWNLFFYARRQALNPTLLFSLTINAPINPSSLVMGVLNTFLSAENTNSLGNKVAIRLYALAEKTGSPSNLTLNTSFHYSSAY
jgi:hypothetical protein